MWLFFLFFYVPMGKHFFFPFSFIFLMKKVFFGETRTRSKHGQISLRTEWYFLCILFFGEIVLRRKYNTFTAFTQLPIVIITVIISTSFEFWHRRTSASSLSVHECCWHTKHTTFFLLSMREMREEGNFHCVFISFIYFFCVFLSSSDTNKQIISQKFLDR